MRPAVVRAGLASLAVFGIFAALWPLARDGGVLREQYRHLRREIADERLV